ncbi:cell division protein FtsK [Kribbella sp. NPDC005582]|uniref:cell division protein FtsK n=1 Tax=Kribbella sp. NPDC005582 TaxID=3156893 RepID=UPI0033B8B428
MPNEPLRLSRRVALLTSGALLLAGCKDDQAGGPGAVDPGSGKTKSQDAPTVDPAVVAALSTAAGLVSSLTTQYAAVGAKFPALKPKLAAAAKFHAGHLAKLQETAGVTAPKAAKPSAVPANSAAALTALATQEKAASVAHAAAAAKISGPPARLLAMIAASEVQLGSTLAPARKAASS